MCRPGTMENYQKLINMMRVWKPELYFDEINLDLIHEFHDYELNVVGNEPSTVSKKHSNFKFLIGQAVEKEKMKKNPYKIFPIKRNHKSKNQDILTEYEISKLQKAYDRNMYSDGKKEVLRDFLFSCYTELSYTKFHKVCYEDIKMIKMPSGEIYPLLTNERVKTGKIYKTPIVSSCVVRLLGEGNGITKIFRPLTYQPTNRYIKEIMKDLNIHKKMTFHVARHIDLSFAL